MCICCGYCRLFTEFYKWKSTEEDSTLSLFTKAHGDRTRKQLTTVQSYYCHRSGRYVSRSRGLRHLKIQGSSKIGRFCPAAMFVRVNPSGILSLHTLQMRA